MDRSGKRIRTVLDAILLTVLLAGVVLASPISVPNTFENGEVADADQVNENFEAVVAGVNALDTSVSALQGQIGTLQAGVRNIVVVSHTGDNAASGSALLAALAAITDASATNPYLVKVGPGDFDLGATSLVMKSYVDLEGSGYNMTRIQGSNTGGTVLGASGMEIRSVRIESSGGRAVTYDGVSYIFPALNQIRDSYLLVTGGADPVALRVNNASVSMDNSLIAVAGAGSKSGIYMTGTSGMTIVGVNIFGTADGSGSAIRLEGGEITVKGGSIYDDYAYALLATGAGSNFQLVGASLVGATYGILAQNSAYGEVIHSDIEQSDNLNSVRVETSAEVRIAASRVDGGSFSGGTLSCIASWDEDFLDAGPTCSGAS
jgi:hypothetical protein